jgi:hypothetical protein
MQKETSHAVHDIFVCALDGMLKSGSKKADHEWREMSGED